MIHKRPISVAAAAALALAAASVAADFPTFPITETGLAGDLCAELS